MNKITKEQAEEWLGIAQSGLIGREYRDVFLRLPEILQSYLAQEEELEKERNFVEAHRFLVQELKAENQVLKETLRIEKLAFDVSNERNQQIEAENEALRATIETLDNELRRWKGQP